MPLALLAPLVLAGSALPLRPGVAPIDSTWDIVDRASDGDCGIVVTGNGRFYLITATGLGANAPARFVLTNGDMNPLDWQVRANSSGRFARYHLPFRWHRRGGLVRISVRNDRCRLNSSFEWRRATADGY